MRLVGRATPARIVLVCGAVIVAGIAVLEMSGSASRTAATNQVNAEQLVATVKQGQRLCAPAQAIPADAGGVRLEVGSYGKPMPAIHAEVLTDAGQIVASGTLPANGPEGYVTVPFHPSVSLTGVMCFTTNRKYPIAVAGQPATPNPVNATLDNKQQAGVLSLTYVLPGSKSWWQMLPTLVTRFGYGKWGFMSGWTFIAGAAAVFLVWIGALRLLWKEFTP